MKRIFSFMFMLSVSIISLMAQSCPDTLRSTATVTITKHAPLPANMLPGKFTINASGDQISFSKGNLQYLAKQNEWRFAENQWTYIGNAVGNTLAGDENRETNVDWIDLFGWATSGNPDATSDGGNYEPWRCNTDNAKYGASETGSNVVWDPSKCDWGVVNMPGSGWRVLSKAEWDYLLNSRPNAAKLKGLAIVHGKKGLVLLPDGWEQINSAMAGRFMEFHSYTSPVHNFSNIDDKSWEVLEKEGAVFLPASGYRNNSSIINYPEQTGSGITITGQYWSATSNNANSAYVMYFNKYSSSSSAPSLSTTYKDRSTGCLVRLVRDR